MVVTSKPIAPYLLRLLNLDPMAGVYSKSIDLDKPIYGLDGKNVVSLLSWHHITGPIYSKPIAPYLLSLDPALLSLLSLNPGAEQIYSKPINHEILAKDSGPVSDSVTLSNLMPLAEVSPRDSVPVPNLISLPEEVSAMNTPTASPSASRFSLSVADLMAMLKNEIPNCTTKCLSDTSTSCLVRCVMGHCLGTIREGSEHNELEYSCWRSCGDTACYPQCLEGDCLGMAEEAVNTI